MDSNPLSPLGHSIQTAHKIHEQEKQAQYHDGVIV
jgi:hypothetical protein